MSLADLFPDGDYRFHLTLRRVEPRTFFATQDPGGRLLAERARWIAADWKRHTALRPEGEPLLREFEAIARGWQTPAGKAADADARTPPCPGSADTRGPAPAEAAIRSVGERFEPDLLFLSPDATGKFRLHGGALCFPTGWALEEKLGHTLEFIHGAVPGLNAALGSPIHQFLSKLKPGVAFLRDNWGIAASDELNLHPARAIPPPGPPVILDRLWLRVEHQALMALPESGGVVFGIRIALHRLDEIARMSIGKKLRSALETMPPELVAYKRLDAVLPQIVGSL